MSAKEVFCCGLVTSDQRGGFMEKMRSLGDALCLDPEGMESGVPPGGGLGLALGLESCFQGTFRATRSGYLQSATSL